MTASPTATKSDPAMRAGVLAEAISYVSRFRGKKIVVKVGGHLLTSPEMAKQFVSDVFMMHAVGMKPVVVHGGGPQISALMKRLGLGPVFKNGHRVTDSESLDVARMVLVGKINRDIVGGINSHAPVALGLSGEDVGLLTVVQRDPDLGFVGDITSVNASLIERLLEDNLIPVVATIGSDETGQAWNINADLGASAVAAGIRAHKLIYLTDVAGIYRDVDDANSLIRETTAGELEGVVASGGVSDGMLPKLEGCIEAVRSGVSMAHILDGSLDHALLVELLTDTGVGTMITKDGAKK